MKKKELEARLAAIEAHLSESKPRLVISPEEFSEHYANRQRALHALRQGGSNFYERYLTPADRHIPKPDAFLTEALKD